jgi:DNA repair protein NreA
MSSNQCKICSSLDCKEHQFTIGKTISIEKFSGSTPPEIFVGKWNYPNVYTGILSPQEYGNNQIMSSPELWHKNKLPISKIMSFRNQLIYGRTQSYIKRLETKFLSVVKEIAMTHKSTATEFKLKKPIKPNKETETRSAIIPKAAQVDKIRLEENTKIKKKVDYLVNDTEVKSAIAIQELSKSKIETSSIIKILSAGLLGLKKNRRLVPTRWSITAVDDTLSKENLKSIRYFPTINEVQLFHAEYVGNHYEFLLLPDKYSFEVIEASWTNGLKFWQDYETFFPRKKYADNVTGGYYAVRLPLTEHLIRIKRQAQCLVMRESRPEYYAPLGVGILRQIAREAFTKKPEKFSSVSEALAKAQTRLQLPMNNFTSRSWLLENYGKQKRIMEFL